MEYSVKIDDCQYNVTTTKLFALRLEENHHMRQIESLTYTNELGESVMFAHTALYNPQTISGLSDVRNTIFSIGSMGQDGDTFVGSRIESRDIDIAGQIRERDPQKMREARRNLARVLNPQLTATLTYRFGSFVRVIGCRTRNAPTITKPAQQVYAGFSVSLECLNPFWREEAERRDDIAAWVGCFEFPLEIPETGFEFGYRQPSLIVNVFNGGDVRCGLRAEFKALGAVENPVIIDMDTKQQIKLNLSMQDGDVVSLCTRYGEKSATLHRGGVLTAALRYVDVGSEFLQLRPGDNLLRYDAAQGLENLEVSIYHHNLYLGV